MKKLIYSLVLMTLSLSATASAAEKIQDGLYAIETNTSGNCPAQMRVQVTMQNAIQVGGYTLDREPVPLFQLFQVNRGLDTWEIDGMGSKRIGGYQSWESTLVNGAFTSNFTFTDENHALNSKEMSEGLISGDKISFKATTIYGSVPEKNEIKECVYKKVK